MDIARRFALAFAVSTALLAAEAAPAAAGIVTGQHRAVMNSIAGAQRRNNAVINGVQRNIRSSQRNRF